jgi:hypothetical protein
LCKGVPALQDEEIARDVRRRNSLFIFLLASVREDESVLRARFQLFRFTYDSSKLAAADKLVTSEELELEAEDDTIHAADHVLARGRRLAGGVGRRRTTHAPRVT